MLSQASVEAGHEAVGAGDGLGVGGDREVSVITVPGFQSTVGAVPPAGLAILLAYLAALGIDQVVEYHVALTYRPGGLPVEGQMKQVARLQAARRLGCKV